MLKMRWLTEVLLLLYLAGEARRDIRTKTVSMYVSLVAGIAAIALHFLCGAETAVQDMVLQGETLQEGMFGGAALQKQLVWISGILPGLFFLAAARITGEQIGYGDGAAVLILGLFLGGSGCIAVVSSALLLLCPAALFQVVFKKAGRKATMPFLPYLLGGYIIWLIMTSTA